MGKHLSALAALLVSGCAPAHAPVETMCDGTLHATVTIEETGEVLAVANTYPAGIETIATGERNDLIVIQFERGERMDIMFARPTAIGTPLPLGADVPDVQVALGRECVTSAMSEGELIFDHLHLNELVDCAIGSLRVRFTGCDAEVFGRLASETTFLVEIGR